MTDTLCPTCLEPIPAGRETCPACGTRVDAHPTWEGQAVVTNWTAPKGTVDQGSGPDEFVPLQAPAHGNGMTIGLVQLASAVALTVAALVMWRIAEVQIVNDDPWAHWDLVWYVSAAVSIALMIAWTVVLVRMFRKRGRRV